MEEKKLDSLSADTSKPEGSQGTGQKRERVEISYACEGADIIQAMDDDNAGTLIELCGACGEVIAFYDEPLESSVQSLESPQEPNPGKQGGQNAI